jgi:simple sugar transport system ATP-binding protein
VNAEAPLLEGRGLTKHFGNVDALRDVSLSVHARQVTCVLGDNGAGKSTFIKILSGVHRQDKGQLLMSGEPVRFGSPREARARGIATVYQDLATMPLMSIWRNFFLGSEPTRRIAGLPFIDTREGHRVVREEMLNLGVDVRDPEQPVGTLSGGERQAVAIARALYFGAKVLILDEPTSALGVRPTANVLRFIANARDRGVGVVFITHNPHHAYPIGDRFVVLNRGRVAGSWERGDLDRDELTSAMAGGAELDELARELQNRAPA